MELPSTLRSCAHWLRHSFLRREDGVIAIETMIIIPIIFWAQLSMFAIHDAFRAQAIHQKTAYSLGDAISRETVELDDAYLDGTHSLFEYLAHSQGDTSMRLSQLTFNGDTEKYERDWSQVRGGAVALSSADVADWHDKLPVIPGDEHIMLLETWSVYDPPFNTGLTHDEIRTFVFTRPRYASRVCWIACPPGI